MDFIGANNQFPCSCPGGETLQLGTGEGSTHRVMGVAEHKEVARLGGGTF